MKSTTVTPCKGGFHVRLRVGPGKRQRFVIALSDHAKAQQRAERMATMARELVDAERTEKALGILKGAGEQLSDEGFESIAQGVTQLCAQPKPEKALPGRQAPTFREFGESWTSGKLHKLYPDQVPLKGTSKDDHSRLTLYVYPTIGAKRLDEVTLDDCEQIMRSIPESAQRSRRHIAGTISRVFKMAVYPCRWLERSPLPAGFLPRSNSRKAFAYLYPSEDARLMACIKVPYEYRLLWGFLIREGMREGEVLRLTWGDLDLRHGMIRLDANKTDDPRSWALDPGVARALTLHRQLNAPNAPAGAPVFIQRSQFGLADTLREHLERVGLKKERPELFVTNASRQRIRVHDLRGTFVTLSLANGKPERWVMARTGHTTSAMISRYHRTAMSFTELNLGELTPLDRALPELAKHASRPTDPAGVGLPVGPTPRKPMKRLASPTGFESQGEHRQAENTDESASSDDWSARLAAWEAQANGAAGPGPQPLDRLAAAIEAAARAGQWDVVRGLTNALHAVADSLDRVVQALPGAEDASSNVVDLATRRGKRGAL